jgi:hypothetical protein
LYEKTARSGGLIIGGLFALTLIASFLPRCGLYGFGRVLVRLALVGQHSAADMAHQSAMRVMI